MASTQVSSRKQHRKRFEKECKNAPAGKNRTLVRNTNDTYSWQPMSPGAGASSQPQNSPDSPGGSTGTSTASSEPGRKSRGRNRLVRISESAMGHPLPDPLRVHLIIRVANYYLRGCVICRSSLPEEQSAMRIPLLRKEGRREIRCHCRPSRGYGRSRGSKNRRQ